MSEREPKPGDTVWLKPAKIMQTYENGQCLVEWGDGASVWLEPYSFAKIEPAPWVPKVGDWATITWDDHPNKQVQIAYLNVEWAMVAVPGTWAVPVKVSELREPML